MKVKDILTEGIENAVSAHWLCDFLGVTPRELTQEIERERRAGAPICATSNSNKPGYYLAGDQQTMQAYCRSLKHREREIAKTRQACSRTIATLPQVQR